MQFGKANGRRKYMIGAIAAVAVLVLGTAPLTYSYLTASSEAVVNTFAGGAISLKLDEALTDSEGNPDADGTRVTENSYKITPGAELTKDPTITVLANSEDAYIFIYVDNELPEEYFSLDYSDSWIEIASTGTKTLYMYKSVVESSDADYSLDPIFTTVTVSEDLTSELIEELGELQITVQSYAVQADGVTEATAIQMAVDFFEDAFSIDFDYEAVTEDADTASSDDSGASSDEDSTSTDASAESGSDADSSSSDTDTSNTTDSTASDDTDSTDSSAPQDGTSGGSSDTAGTTDDTSVNADDDASAGSTQDSDSVTE